MDEGYLDEYFRVDLRKPGEGWDTISEDHDLLKSFPFLDDPEFKKLTARDQRFLLAYSLKDYKNWFLVDCVRFAYNDFAIPTIPASWTLQGIRKKPAVKYFIDKIEDIRLIKLGVLGHRILEEETAIAYSDITDYLDPDGLCPIKNLKTLPPALRRAIQSVEFVYMDDGSKKCKLKLWDKGQSLARLEKCQGMGVENFVVKGHNISMNINPDTDPTEAAKLYLQMVKGVEGKNQEG